MEKRNGIISFWKFIFAIVIVFFHTHQFYTNTRNPFFSGGYIAVEFFFIVSGYFFAKSLLKSGNKSKDISKETFNFVFTKIKKFSPYILVAYILSFIIQGYYSHWTLDKYINSICNLLLFNGIGVGKTVMLGQLWYISSMLIVMYFLYPFLKKYKEKYVVSVIPLVITIGISYMFGKYQTLNLPLKQWIGLIHAGIFRGFVEMNIGILIFYISEKLKNVEYTKFGRLVLTAISELSLIAVLVITSFATNYKKYDFVMLLMISISVLIMVSKKTLEFNLLSNKFFYYLEKISLPIFINHLVFINIVYFIDPFKSLSPIIQSFLVILMTLLFSPVEEFAFSKIQNKKYGLKIKHLFIK